MWGGIASSAFHFKGFFKDFLVSFLSYVFLYAYVQDPFLFHAIDPGGQQTASIPACM